MHWNKPTHYELPLTDIDSTLMESIVHDWTDKLKMLSCGKDSDRFPALDEINCHTRIILNAQRQKEALLMEGSWALPLDVKMPSDYRVDFAFFPTYIAISWLMLIKTDFSESSKDHGEIDRALKKGMKFACGRKLSGHGYDADREMLEAINIFSLGGVFAFIEDNPTFCLKFSRMIENVVNHLESYRDKHEDVDWGYISTESRHLALTQIKGDRQKIRACTAVYKEWMHTDASMYVNAVCNSVIEHLPTLLDESIGKEIEDRSDEIISIAAEVTKGSVFRSQAFGRRSDPTPLVSQIDISSEISTAQNDLDSDDWIPPLKGCSLVSEVRQILTEKLGKISIPLSRMIEVKDSLSYRIVIADFRLNDGDQVSCMFHVEVGHV